LIGDRGFSTGNSSAEPIRATTIGGRRFDWGERTYLMGVLNVTPDSFSGDGVGRNVDAAVKKALALEAGGADLIDIGGESTRPGHIPISADEELERVLPALEAIVREVGVPISVDTSKAIVARAALKAGAALVNDVSGTIVDDRMAGTIREFGVPAVIMARGASRSADVVERVRADLDEALGNALNCGIPRERLLIDPGFGFGKDWRDNLALLHRLYELRTYALPIVVGLSRKSTIAKVLGSEPEFRVAANATLAALAVAGGAEMVRIHDVAQVGAAVRMADAVVRGPGPPAGRAGG
jgi:dihydropteroate synthase